MEYGVWMTTIVSFTFGAPLRLSAVFVTIIACNISTLQLVDHPEMTPRDVCDPNLVRAYADEYLYLEGIQ